VKLQVHTFTLEYLEKVSRQFQDRADLLQSQASEAQSMASVCRRELKRRKRRLRENQDGEEDLSA